jgi:hypothetical protein
LEDIARTCGLFPLELRSLLNHLVASGALRRTSIGYAPAGSTDETPEVAGEETVGRIPELPLPHPLDFDWRFDPQTLEFLAEELGALAGQRDGVLLLGAPSLFATLLAMPSSPRAVLVDANGMIVRALGTGNGRRFRAVHRDLLAGPDPALLPEAAVALCDPPWYPEYYRAFLAQAAVSTRIGGRVLLSVMPVLTRPGALADRDAIFREATRLGLHLHGLHPGRLRYDTPPFERASLAAGGVASPRPWRHGDLGVFWKFAEPDHEALVGSIDRRDPVDCWFEMEIGGRTIKLRGPFEDANEAPKLLHIEPHDVLPTVSRRYPGRDRVDLWLWDNRVFGARGRAAFRAALRTLAGKDAASSEPAIPRHHLTAAIAALQTIPELADRTVSADPSGGRNGGEPSA